jgi:hypothetical protein
MISNHAFAEDAVFADEVGIILRYKTATAQAGLKFMTAHFETNALLSGQYCNIPAVLRHSRERLHAKHECIGSEDKIKRNKTHINTQEFFFSSKKKISHQKQLTSWLQFYRD